MNHQSDTLDQMTAPDPLLDGPSAERVNYATGVLLSADDFRDEQTYHRSRLASALRYLVGHGTLAGLAVRAPEAEDNDLHLRVEPGIALDRHGRMIEVVEPWCIRLAHWLAAQPAGALRWIAARCAPTGCAANQCASRMHHGSTTSIMRPCRSSAIPASTRRWRSLSSASGARTARPARVPCPIR